MAKFFTSKAVQVSQKNVTASIVGFGATPANPFLRFTFKADGDFGASSTGKMHSMAASNDVVAGIRASFNAYRKATVSAAELGNLIKGQIPSGGEAEAEDFGAVITPARASGRGYIVRGSTKDGCIHVDIPHTTISLLASPNTTFKERDAVAPPSSKGNKRLIASTAGFAGFLDGALGLSFNIMLEIDQTIDSTEIATTFGLKKDDPLFANLCGSASLAAAEKSANALTGFSEAVRRYLRGLKAEQIAEAVDLVFTSKLKASGVEGNASAAEKAKILSKLKVEDARNWVITALVEAAVNKIRIDHVVAGNDLAELRAFMPSCNVEILDLFESTPDNDAVKALVKRGLLDALQTYMPVGADAGEAEEEKPAKKRRSEKSK